MRRAQAKQSLLWLNFIKMIINYPDSVSLRLKWVAEYHGPNPCAEAAVVVAELTADRMPPGDHVKMAVERLWRQSGMAPADDAALRHRLEQGGQDDALLALAMAATTWAQAALNEVRGHVQHAGAGRAGGAVRLWVGFHHADLSRIALQLALRTLAGLISSPPHLPALQAELDKLWQACRHHHPDYQARILMVGAQDMEVPCLHFLPGSRYWQFGWGDKARVFMESASNQDGMLGSQWQKSKVAAKALMTALGLPTPRHVLVARADELPAAVERIGFPCVLKPLDSGGGKGVTANIRSLAEAQAAFKLAFRQKQDLVMVEAHVQGEDHRLMVINGQMVAAIRREPSFVVGDGRNSVAALVAHLNASRSKNMVRSRYLRPIPMDEVLRQHLATQLLTLTDVPAPGQRVTLRSNANLSTGGMCTDVTALCHPQVRAMAELLASTSGLATIGIDYLTTDIARPSTETGGVFIEMNTTPGLDACVAAAWPEALIARRVLGESVGRIPVDLTITSADGLEALRKGLEKPRLDAGQALVVRDTLYLGDLVLHVGSSEPWAAVKAGLRNPCVRGMRVICSVEELVGLGCPVDRVRHVTMGLRDGQAILPPAWEEVIRRHSESVVEARLP